MPAYAGLARRATVRARALCQGCGMPAGPFRSFVALVRQEIGPIACFRAANVVARLPKTRSGKILRKTLREIAEGRDPQVPSTIDDPAVLDELTPVVRGERG